MKQYIILYPCTVANGINLQLAIRILKNQPVGHALPPNGHSGRI